MFEVCLYLYRFHENRDLLQKDKEKGFGRGGGVMGGGLLACKPTYWGGYMIAIC